MHHTHAIDPDTSGSTSPATVPALSAAPYEQMVFSMGHAEVDLTKAAALAAHLEDEALISALKRQAL